MLDLPNYSELSLALVRAGISANAAEIHGVFCGAAVLLGPHAGAIWLKETLAECQPDNAASSEVGRSLAQVALTTFQMLENCDMSLILLLPSDDETLKERTESLALWCQGFMHGVVLGNGGDEKVVDQVFSSELSKEIIDDFAQITRAASDIEESDEDELNKGENAFFELTEYVRVSSQLVFEESACFRVKSEHLGS